MSPKTNSPALHLSPEDWARLQAVAPCWNDDIVKHRAIVLDIYRPLVQQANKQGVEVTRDLGYGLDPRQCLDVFAPVDGSDRPVLVFVHGGAFTRGSKSIDGEIYDNVLHWFARHGFVGVNVEYRLAPAAQFPSGAVDVSRAVAWVAENVGRYGGNPNKLVLMGHSAGGCHVASYLLDPATKIAPHASVKAAVLVSARLRLESLADNPNFKNVAAYAGEDSAVLERCSPINYVERCRWPVFIAIAEYENRYLDAYGLEFASRLAHVRRRAPRFVQMRGHNHTSIVAHFNTAEEWLGWQIVDFLNDHI